MSGCIVGTCDYCGRDMDVRLSWPVFDVRGCSPDCARKLGLLHYKRANEAMLDHFRDLEVRIQRFEE